MKRRRLLLAALALPMARAANAQTTSKSLRIIVPFPAGGGTDVAARLIADKLRGNYAPAVIVENRVGASGRTGVEAAAHAAPDGSTPSRRASCTSTPLKPRMGSGGPGRRRRRPGSKEGSSDIQASVRAHLLRPMMQISGCNRSGRGTTPALPGR